jgi:hypothetical protein
MNIFSTIAMYLMLVCLFEKKWLDDGFMKGFFFLRFCRYGSVFKGTANDNCVPSPAVDAMVSKAIDYVTINTPPRSPTPPELHLLYECGTPPHKG